MKMNELDKFVAHRKVYPGLILHKISERDFPDELLHGLHAQLLSLNEKTETLGSLDLRNAQLTVEIVLEPGYMEESRKSFWNLQLAARDMQSTLRMVKEELVMGGDWETARKKIDTVLYKSYHGDPLDK